MQTTSSSPALATPLTLRASHIDILNSTLADGGPVYTETQLGRTIAEPMNALTAFPFLLIALYWALKLRGQYREKPLLSLCLVLLALGGVGGTLFHALRASSIFFILDVVPIGLTTTLVSLYLWSKAIHPLWKVIPIWVPALVIYDVAFFLLPRQFAISISYCVLAALILIPMYLLLKRSEWMGSDKVIGALICFGIAIFFRSADPFSGRWMAIGTHWLWHVFSSVSVGLLIVYVLNVDKNEKRSGAGSLFSQP